jgi:hypothetical protein
LRAIPSIADLIIRNITMALHAKPVRPVRENATEEPISQRQKSELGPFRLQVDRQTKASFSSYEAAEQAGLKIKKAHPVVRVSVYDAVECINRIIEAPKAPSGGRAPAA